MMTFQFLLSSLSLFIIASSARFTTSTSIPPAERHIIKHTHKINCLNCFCGDEGIKRARHSCSKDRDLILCPQTIPGRICYRCSCFPRIPVSPSPPVMISHSDDHKDDNVHKQEDSHNTGQDDQKQDETRIDKEGQKHRDDLDDHNHENNDLITPTPDEDDGKVDMPTPEPSMSKLLPLPSKTPTSPHTPKPKSSQRTCSTFSRGGGGGNTMFGVNLLSNHGLFKVTWQMNRVPDRVEIFYEEKKIFTTNVPVSGRGSAYVKYSGNSHIITVWVTGPTDGTGWFMSIGCPTSG